MKRYIMYEIKNLLGNVFAIVFGLIFPVIMTHILMFTVVAKVPEPMKGVTTANIFVTNLIVIPLALMFIGFAAMFSQELEKNVINRMSLFGINETKQMISKMIAQFSGVIVSVGIYCLFTLPFISLPSPSLYAVLVLVGALIMVSIALFVLSFAIALILKKFSLTYGITMSLYFVIMFFSGMMGNSVDDLPSGIQMIAKLFPMSFMTVDIPKAWQLNSYNFMPMYQSILFFTFICGIIGYYALRSYSRELD